MFKSGSKYLIFFVLFFLLLFSWTCKRTVSPGYTDIDAIKDYIITHPSIFSADVFNTSSTDPNFYREITKRDNWIRINFYEPDSLHPFRYANVTWDDSIQGVFHSFISGNEYIKEFNAFSRVRAYFEQWGDPGNVYRGWLLTKISNLLIYSLPNSVGFSNLRIDTSGALIYINPDVLYLYELIPDNKVLQFRQSTEVTFIIQAADTTDSYFLHVYERGAWRKIPFRQVSGKEYKASWTVSSSTQDLNIYKHAYIDCLDSRSVTDSSYRYDSRSWGILYRIKKP